MIGFNLKSVLVMILGLLVSSSVCAGQTPAQTAASVHSLSLKVFVDGKEIMAPNLDILPGRTAYVTLNSTTKGPYTLQLDVVGDSLDGLRGSAGLQAVLWNGGVNHGARLLEALLLLDPTPSLDANDRATPASVSVGSKVGAQHSAEIQIVSHAVVMADIAQFSAGVACLSSEGLAAVQPKGRGCCTRECGNKREEMTCCGAVRCCACDVCCSPR